MPLRSDPSLTGAMRARGIGRAGGHRRHGCRLDRRFAFITAALVAFASLYAAVRSDRTHALDLAVTLRLQARRSRWLRHGMRAASWPGYPPQSRTLPLLVIGGWLVAGLPRAAAYQTASWGGAVLSTIVKFAVHRPRPLPPEVQVALAPLGGSSFPSGHVLTYVAFYGFLAYLVASHVRPPLARRVLVGGLSGLVAVVGPSRIQQGHHWPTDVTASYLLGSAYLVVLVVLYERGRPAPGAAALMEGPVAERPELP
ncbi:MAG TPA: phosphatase PAP2 family protein [Candidatus Limnocylindrales bacterium]